jgi:hypothetical protein
MDRFGLPTRKEWIVCGVEQLAMHILPKFFKLGHKIQINSHTHPNTRHMLTDDCSHGGMLESINEFEGKR